MRIYEIKWETDGEDIDLPTEIEFDMDDPVYGPGSEGYDDLEDYLDEMADTLSEKFEFLHDGFKISDDIRDFFRKTWKAS